MSVHRNHRHLPSQQDRKVSQKVMSRPPPVKTTKGTSATRTAPSGSLAGIPMAGAVLVGACLGGPVGLLAGIKIGAFVGLGGSLMGYSTANMVEEHM